jgi:hypothetical protein
MICFSQKRIGPISSFTANSSKKFLTKMIDFLHSSANVANLIIRHNILTQSMVKSHLLIPQLLTIYYFNILESPKAINFIPCTRSLAAQTGLEAIQKKLQKNTSGSLKKKISMLLFLP